MKPQLYQAVDATHSRCESCGVVHLNRSLIIYKGEVLCFRCRLKKENYEINLLNYNNNIFPTTKTIPNALAKTYKVRTYITRRGYPACSVGVPSCLAGHTVKLILVLN